MKKIKGVNVHNLEVVVKGDISRHDVDLGALTLSVEDREFIFDVVQSYSEDTEDGIRISCDIEPDEETFDECPYNLTKEDLLDCEHNNLERTLFVGGEEDFELVSILFHFDIDGQDYQIKIEQE